MTLEAWAYPDARAAKVVAFAIAPRNRFSSVVSSITFALSTYTLTPSWAKGFSRGLPTHFVRAKTCGNRSNVLHKKTKFKSLYTSLRHHHASWTPDSSIEHWHLWPNLPGLQLHWPHSKVPCPTEHLKIKIRRDKLKVLVTLLGTDVPRRSKIWWILTSERPVASIPPFRIHIDRGCQHESWAPR